MSDKEDDNMNEWDIPAPKTDALIVPIVTELPRREEATEEDGIINRYLSILEKDLRCSYCSGWGHDAKHCATLQ